MADEKDFNEEEIAQHLLEGGANRARKAIELKRLAEEEELSEDELRQQVDHGRFHKFMQERRKKDTDKALEDHSRQMQAELESLLKPSDNLLGSKRVDAKMPGEVITTKSTAAS